ncbi:hypothetical protein BXY57_2213 [Thermoflavifilum aggregans]|uniref:Uncharacterized protein n=1 Tax=Thermoflavifilum aggregans TaxID=454188 RepID=A0A2M9CXF5_9BACT|nr:hypothetical protein BXY57_2213 [Thermoflavifilum aggregans]
MLFVLNLFTLILFVREIHFLCCGIEKSCVRQIWNEYIYLFKHHPPKVIIIFSSSKVFNYMVPSNVKYYFQLCKFIDQHYSIYVKSQYYSILNCNY